MSITRTDIVRVDNPFQWKNLLENSSDLPESISSFANKSFDMIALAQPVEIPASEDAEQRSFTAEEIRSDIVNFTDDILDESHKVKRRTTIILSVVVLITAVAVAVFF